MSRIFISHSSKNEHEAFAIEQWLKSEGWVGDNDIYLDISPESGMQAGQGREK